MSSAPDAMVDLRQAQYVDRAQFAIALSDQIDRRMTIVTLEGRNVADDRPACAMFLLTPDDMHQIMNAFIRHMTDRIMDRTSYVDDRTQPDEG